MREMIDNQTSFNKLTDCVICHEYVEPYTGAYTRDGFLAHKARRAEMKDCYSRCPDGVRLDRQGAEGTNMPAGKMMVDSEQDVAYFHDEEVREHLAESRSCKHGQGFTYDFCPVVNRVNQHAALLAERKRLRAALRRLSVTGRGALPLDEYRDWVKEVADEALATGEQGGE